MVDLDLFGEPVRYERTIQHQYLIDKDEEDLGNRLRRLNYLHEINPGGIVFSGDMETVFCYREMQEAYIDGHFLSTIVLGQSWIEKNLQIYLEQLGHERITEKGFAKMIAFCGEHRLAHEYLLRKADYFRLIRNPITHLKRLSYDHSLSRRSFGSGMHPLHQLESEAQQIVGFALHVVIYGWR